MKKIFEDYLNINTYMEIKENIIKNFNEQKKNIMNPRRNMHFDISYFCYL